MRHLKKERPLYLALEGKSKARAIYLSATLGVDVHHVVECGLDLLLLASRPLPEPCTQPAHARPLPGTRREPQAIGAILTATTSYKP